MLQHLQAGQLTERVKGSRRKKTQERRSKNRKERKRETGFLPAVGNNNEQISHRFQRQEQQQPEQNTFKAIRLTKHDLHIESQPSANLSPVDSNTNTRSHNSKKKIIGVRTNSLDSSEVQLGKQGAHNSKKEFTHRDGFSIASKSNSVTHPNVHLNATQSSQPSTHLQAGSALAMQPRNTSTNLPRTSKVFIQQHNSSQRVSDTKDSKRQCIQLSSQNGDSNENEQAPDHISFDQESQNEEQTQLQSMFDPAVNNITASGQMMVSPDGVNFPMLNNPKMSSDLNNTQTSWRADVRAHSKTHERKNDMLTTKNSLFSKQSNSVVTQEDQYLQDMKATESVRRVRELFKLKVEEPHLQDKKEKRVHFRRAAEPKPQSIFLRRTSSALSTKYSRKFLSNMQVRAALAKPTKEMSHNASISMPPTIPRPPPLQTQRFNNDSIYTIGEIQDSHRKFSPRNHQKSISSGSGGQTSRSRSNSNNQQRSNNIPSYREHTLATHQRRPSKDIHRSQMSRAIEDMRLAQLKQSRLNRQNVNRVCEDLMKIEKVKKDPELEQFGRNYLKKLYSVDREFSSTGQPTRMDRHKQNKNFSMTMQSFSIGSQHPSAINSQIPSIESNYKGRIGAKGMSLQPTISITAALGSNNISGMTTPFKATQPTEFSVMKNQRLQNQRSNDATMLITKGQSNSGKISEEDYLLSGLMSEHLDPSKGQIVVTLDGELGQSFIQYLASDQAKAYFVKENIEQPKPDLENLLEEGIMGTQKPIMPNLSPRNKVLRNALQVDKRAHNAAKKMATKLFSAPMSFLHDQTTSSPPDTAQDQESLQTTQQRHDLRMMLSSGQSLRQDGQSHEPYRQMMTNEHQRQQHHYQIKPLDQHSLVSQDTNNTNKIEKSRLNTGTVTAYGAHTLQLEQDRVDTQQESRSLSKRQPKKVGHPVIQSHQNRQDYLNKMFEKKSVQRAMDQHVEMFQSFGGEGKDPPYKLDFEDNRAQTGRPSSQEKQDAGSALRESYERKVVPLNVKQNGELATGSINTSRDGDTPMIEIASSHAPVKPMELQTVGQGTILFANTEEDRKLAQQTQLSSAHIIHSPSIVTKDRRTILREKAFPTPPLDITMTNYAIDKEFLEKQGSPIHSAQLKASQSPPNTKTVNHRKEGTKQLLQQAQLDPNSFLHTQPIHFDNYHIQARPLAKTIYGKQYKQAKEKMAQAKEKIKLIEKEKAVIKQSNQMQQMMMILNDSSQEASQEILTQTNIMTANLSSPRSPKLEETNPMNMMTTPKEHINSGGVTVRSMPDTTIGVNSALAMSPGMKPDHRLHNNHNNGQDEREQYQVVDTQMGSEAGSSMIQNKKFQEHESRITINLNDKDFSRTLHHEDLVREGGPVKRLGTSGTLTPANQKEEFMRQSNMSDKETVMRLPQVVKTAEPKDRGPQPSAQIITEVQAKSSPRKMTNEKNKKGKPVSIRKQSKVQKMTVVQNVKMEELMMNGMTIQEAVRPKEVPLKTERVFAKFKGKSPIGSNKPNFLNRKRLDSSATKEHAMYSTTPAPPENSRMMTEQSSLREDLNGLSPSYNKALKVFPLRQQQPPSQVRESQNSPSTQMLQSGLTVAFAHNGKLLGHTNVGLLTQVKEPTLLKNQGKPNSTDITAALQVAQNFDHSNNATSYVMISSPQIRSGVKEADSSGLFQIHPKNYTAKLQKDETSPDKVGHANSPSPVSGESDNLRPTAKDHLTAKRLDADGANTRITHRRAEDDLTPVQQHSQQNQKLAGFASATIEIPPEESKKDSTISDTGEQSVTQVDQKLSGQAMANNRLNDPSNNTSMNKENNETPVSP